MPSRIRIVSRAGVPFLKQTIASRRTATLGSRDGELVEQRPVRVDVAGMRPREPFERDQGRAAHGRAVVLEPAAEQLELLAEAELGDRPVGERAHPVVVAPARRLDLVGPFAAERGELALQATLRVLVRERGGLREIHQLPPSERGPGPT